MIRRVLAIILLVVAISVVIMTPVLAFTPMGTQLLNRVTQLAPQATPTPTALPPTPTPSPTPTPILTVVGKPPVITSGEAILLDADTGHILDDVNGETPLPMASTTKIMTALVAMLAGDLNAPVLIKQDAYNEVHRHDGSSAELVVGDSIPLNDLLYGLMLPSGDDAAIAIADGVSSSSEHFVQTMNLLAFHLRLFHTHYINPDGLTYYDANGQPLPGHYTTAYDLVRLAQYAMTFPLFAQIVSTQSYILPANVDHHAYSWVNTDSLLGTYQGATGIKTGYTVEAGYCLVFSATHAGHHLIGALLDDTSSDHRFTDAKVLLNWGFGLPLLPPTQ